MCVSYLYTHTPHRVGVRNEPLHRAHRYSTANWEIQGVQKVCNEGLLTTYIKTKAFLINSDSDKEQIINCLWKGDLATELSHHERKNLVKIIFLRPKHYFVCLFYLFVKRQSILIDPGSIWSQLTNGETARAKEMQWRLGPRQRWSSADPPDWAQAPRGRQVAPEEGPVLAERPAPSGPAPPNHVSWRDPPSLAAAEGVASPRYLTVTRSVLLGVFQVPPR